MPDIAGSEQHKPTSLWGIAKKAKEDSKHRFGNLYNLLNETNLRWSFTQLNRKAAPGVDAVDYETYETDLEANISKMVEELKDGNYKAKLVRRHYIPKIGGRRPLGIPTVGDKVLQTAAAQILSAIYEQDIAGIVQSGVGLHQIFGSQSTLVRVEKPLPVSVAEPIPVYSVRKPQLPQTPVTAKPIRKK